MQQLFMLCLTHPAMSLFIDAYSAQLNIFFQFFCCARVVLVHSVVLVIALLIELKKSSRFQ
jgi:hypothetical protein